MNEQNLGLWGKFGKFFKLKIMYHESIINEHTLGKMF